MTYSEIIEFLQTLADELAFFEPEESDNLPIYFDYDGFDWSER